MNKIKGFVSINELINNTTNTVSILGELSPLSLTYSKDRGEYQNIAFPGYSLISFKSIDSLDNSPIIINQIQVAQIIEIVDACVSYSKANTRPLNKELFKDTIASDYQADISNLIFGNLKDNGVVELPEYLSWIDITTSNEIKIWLSDTSFSDQYDEYEITVIPPLNDLDIFFNPYNTVLESLVLVNFETAIGNMNNARNNKPETILQAYNYDFINTGNVTEKSSTTWLALVYGKAGNNIDAIKDAIINYILDNSTHTQEQWEVIFPELFKRTEFIILPRWDRISIENLSQLSSLYSSMMEPYECVAFAKANIPFYTDDFINDNIHIIPYDYKAISLVVVNGANNILTKQNIAEMYPDYIPVSSSSLDFNRMQILTRNWLLVLGNLIIAAETLTEESVVPVNVTRIVRSGILFATATFDNVNYLVAARSNSFYTV